jgi:hypothetical protein
MQSASAEAGEIVGRFGEIMSAISASILIWCRIIISILMLWDRGGNP